MCPKCLVRNLSLVLIIILAVILVGCSGDFASAFGDQGQDSLMSRLFSWKASPGNPQSGDYAPGTYPIDPIFADFYQALGGEDILGPAISPAQRADNQTRQYTESSLMLYNPLAPASTQFKLSPLGVTLGVEESSLLGLPSNDGRMINGHMVSGEFLQAYEQLGGARFVGRPISEVVHNTEKQRLEQYFENLGFYRLDGKQKVYLIPYGAYACNRNCRDQVPVAGIPGKQTMLPDSFVKKALELGLEFVGKPLTGLHIARDGKQEVIFENLVLAADIDTQEQVVVRPISGTTSMHASDLAYPQESGLSEFFEVENGLGYNVPNYFIEYLGAYGGMQVAGNPISEVFSPEPGIYWQCFTNLCLQFDLNTDGDQRLRPVPLGKEYKSEQVDQVRDFKASQSLEDIDIKVWESNTFVSSTGAQEIHTAIFQDGVPLPNFELLLIATMPDGSQRKAYFQPSDQDGTSAIQLAPINAPNGTLIAYQVCLFGLDGEQTCVGDNYLIWDAD